MSEALGPVLHKVCKCSAEVKLKAVLKFDGFNACRVLAFWFQAKSTNDSMSLLTMNMNPDRAKDLNDMMNKLDRWDAVIRDTEMKFEKDDISDKMRQAALFAMAPEVVVEHRLAGRRDLDNDAKVRYMIDDMIRDKKRSERSHQIEWRRQSTTAGCRPVEGPRNDVGLRGRIERRRE